MIQKVLWLALAGALGTVSRYGLTGLVHKIMGASFPWGTILVNLTGCFLAGLLWSLFENRWVVSGQTRIILLVGFMGALTTFSTMVLETSEFLSVGDWLHGLANMFIQNGFGILALLVGVALGHMM